jgi:hypothetical protein
VFALAAFESETVNTFEGALYVIIEGKDPIRLYVRLKVDGTTVH